MLLTIITSCEYALNWIAVACCHLWCNWNVILKTTDGFQFFATIPLMELLIVIKFIREKKPRKPKSLLEITRKV